MEKGGRFGHGENAQGIAKPHHFYSEWWGFGSYEKSRLYGSLTIS